MYLLVCFSPLAVDIVYALCYAGGEELIAMKTATYNIRLDPVVKANAEKTFAAFGLNLSEAITVFLHKAVMAHGFPFDVRETPNERLRAAMAETEQILKEYADGTRKPQPFTNAHDMIQEILAEEDEENAV
jgi:DNA-damage-inducible protein J